MHYVWSLLILVIGVLCLYLLWFKLDLGVSLPRGPVPKWSANTSVPPPDEFQSLWFPRDPSGATATDSSQRSIAVKRAIYVSGKEYKRDLWRVEQDGVAYFTHKAQWTPILLDETDRARALLDYNNQWVANGLQGFTASVSFEQISPNTWKVMYERQCDGVFSTFVYEIARNAQDVWRLSPQQMFVETTHSLAAQSVPVGRVVVSILKVCVSLLVVSCTEFGIRKCMKYRAKVVGE